MNNEQRSISTDRQLAKAKRKVEKQVKKLIVLSETEPRKLASPTMPLRVPHGVRTVRPLVYDFDSAIWDSAE